MVTNAELSTRENLAEPHNKYAKRSGGFRHRIQRPTSQMFYSLITIAFLVDLTVGLLAHKQWTSPQSSTYTEYIISTTDQIAVWTGRIFWFVIVIFYVLIPLIRGKPFQVTDWPDIVQKILSRFRTTLKRRVYAIGVLIFEVLALVGLLVAYFIAPELTLPPSGHLVAYRDRLLAINEGRIVVLNSKSFTPMLVFPPIKDLENITGTKDDPPKRIFATEFDGRLHVLSTETGQEERTPISTENSASAIALSADGKKLYVGIQGPIPEGEIKVYDASSLAYLKSIRGVGCPMNFSTPSGAHFLFVATQCGGGQDPVYVIDTRSDEVKASIPGFAVGTSVVASPDAKKVFVSTGDNLRILEDYLSRFPKITTTRLSVGPMSITPDGSLLFIGSPPGLKVLKVGSGKWCPDVRLEAVPTALAIAPNGSLFAQLPSRFFVTDASALKCND